MKYCLHDRENFYGCVDTLEQAECMADALGGAAIEHIEQFGDEL